MLPVVLDQGVKLMYGFAMLNLVKFLILLPWVYNYNLRRSLAYGAFVFYAAYNVAYGLTEAGVFQT